MVKEKKLTLCCAIQWEFRISDEHEQVSFGRMTVLSPSLGC